MGAASEKDCSGSSLSARVNGHDDLGVEDGLDDKEWCLEREGKEKVKENPESRNI